MGTQIALGLTRSDRAAGYSSFDGYREGARQDVLVIEVETRLVVGLSIEAIAEAVFVATNAPAEVVERHGALAREVYACAADLADQDPHVFRSLSVGDTVAVDGTRVACSSFGWQRV